jgi:hypothetical protein
MPFDKLNGSAYDQEVITLMRSALDEAWSQLTPIEQTKTLKSDLAARILRAASLGERDPIKLRAAALWHIASRPSWAE